MAGLVVFSVTLLGPSFGAGNAPRGAAPGGEDSAVTIEYIAHASFRIRSQSGREILIDPYASRIWLGYDFPTGITPDAILISHPHYDHDAGQRRGRPFPWGPEIRVLRDPGSYHVGDITIRGIRGKHADPYGKEFGQINTIWLIEVHGVRIAHLGDNGPLTASNVEELGRVDMLMMPIDAAYHILGPTEITEIREALRPRWLIPMHYRIPALESSADSPRDLGPIDPWLAGEQGVRRLGTHIVSITRDSLPERDGILVFTHSPKIPGPRD